MIKHVILSGTEAALIVNDVVVMTADADYPGDDLDHLEMVAEKLSEALEIPLQRVERRAPSGEWTWDDVAVDLAIDAAVPPAERSPS